jgi:hypothetical protein
MKTGHVADLLPAYLNGTLGADDRRRVGRHLESCPACREELASWRAVGVAAARAFGPVPAPPEGALAGALAEAREEGPSRRSAFAGRVSLAWQLLVGQLPLVRREIWAASALTMTLGCVVALLMGGTSAAGATLAVFAPVVAAVGVAFVYGPENDPSLEVALSTPTPPRLVLLARLVLVYGYDLGLALAATVVLAAARMDAGLVWPLVSLWIGPMLFLSALALLVSLLFGSTPAVLVAMGLWATRLFASGYAGSTFTPAGVDFVNAFWQTDLVLVLLAALCLAVALLHAPGVRQRPVA